MPLIAHSNTWTTLFKLRRSVRTLLRYTALLTPVSTQINRFARKIFDKRWCRTDTVNEWVAHLHANDLDHPNLMEAFSASHHGNYFFIVSELAQCTLWDFLNGGGQVAYSSQELWTQVHGLASGLAYLHGHEVKGGKQKNERLYHQDLKPSNILIINNVMKIADFGLSDYKPDPRMTDSILVGDSKHEGAKVYAPPSRSGPLSDKYDIYSLGTILSEIASYDVGKETQVDRYRKNRQQDGQESEGSIQFYYPKTFKLKRSVFDEHSDVLEAAEKKRDAPIEATVDRWQENFYQKGLFDLIEQMLHFAESIRPSATEVVEKLESRIHGASSALRGSQPYNIDIWDSTMKGSVPVNARPPDIALNCRLYVFLFYLLPLAVSSRTIRHLLNLKAGVHQQRAVWVMALSR
jgi:serine/threonine protein kinase